MKFLASSKWLCALLAVASVGMGVQTYYLVQVHRQLGKSEVRAAEAAVSIEPNDAEGQPAALSPSDPPRSLARVDALADLDQAEERMRSLFDSFYDRVDRSFGGSWLDTPFFADRDSFPLSNLAQLSPRVDLRDRGDSFEVIVDVPGAEEADVMVSAEEGTLVVEGTRATSTEESEPGSFVRRERHIGRFERRLALPETADEATLNTEFENGVLKVRLKKKS